MSIRLAEPRDHDAIARICLLTGHLGEDATGRFADDTALADVYATPYLHGPGGFCLVWDEGAGAVGYVLGTTDTETFQRWFVDTWWPSVTHAQETDADRELHRSARDPERMLTPFIAEYPAHLHIDLLPDAQGRGAGRALINAMLATLAERGVPGVHLVAARGNVGAQAFYPRVGFSQLAADDGGVTFGQRVPVP